MSKKRKNKKNWLREHRSEAILIIGIALGLYILFKSMEII